MKEITSLIEQLLKYKIATDPDRPIHPEICDRAATVLQELVDRNEAIDRLIKAAEEVREVDCTIFCCDKETWADFCGALDDIAIAAVNHEDK